MNRRYVTVDVFTDQAFGGNPLAVVLDADGLDTAAMQAVAREFNYSETTFVLPPQDSAHTAQVRIFTPSGEVPFAGHPNVGTAFVLAMEGNHASRLLFEEIAGLVPVDIVRENGEVTSTELTAPQPLEVVADMPAGRIAACLGLEPADLVGEPRIASVGLRFAFAEVATREALARAAWDAAVFADTFPRDGAFAVYFYCRGGGGFDIHSRMFFRPDGMREDPATGSATVTLAALLAEAGPDGETRLRIEQGRDMGRPSTLLTRTVKQDGTVRSAHVGGRCVTIMRGTLSL